MTRRPIMLLAAGLFGAIAAFFVFYEARLLYVTRALREIRTGGRGAYVGAIVFPIIAIVFAYAARRCWRASRDPKG